MMSHTLHCGKHTRSRKTPFGSFIPSGSWNASSCIGTEARGSSTVGSVFDAIRTPVLLCNPPGHPLTWNETVDTVNSFSELHLAHTTFITRHEVAKALDFPSSMWNLEVSKGVATPGVTKLRVTSREARLYPESSPYVLCATVEAKMRTDPKWFE